MVVASLGAAPDTLCGQLNALVQQELVGGEYALQSVQVRSSWYAGSSD